VEDKSFRKKRFGIVCTEEEAKDYVERISNTKFEAFYSGYVVARWDDDKHLGHTMRLSCHLEKRACIGHEYVTIHPGDPIYERTFCKHYGERQ